MSAPGLLLQRVRELEAVHDFQRQRYYDSPPGSRNDRIECALTALAADALNETKERFFSCVRCPSAFVWSTAADAPVKGVDAWFEVHQ